MSDIEPEHLRCPILHTLYRDPVFVIDSGNTYDREAILGFWSTSPEPRDPLTNTVLPSTEVRTNWGVRREVQTFLDRHPDFLPEGWDSRELPPPDELRRVDRPAQVEPPPDVGPDGVPVAVRQHVAAVAAAHGGTLPDQVIRDLANALGADEAVLLGEFGRRAEAAPAAEQPAPGANPAGALPPVVTAHCRNVAQAHGGFLPDELVGHLAGSFNVDEALLRAAFGRRGAEQGNAR